MPAEPRVEFMRRQNRRPRLPPDLPVQPCGQRPSIVENEYRVLLVEIAPDGLLLQDRRQVATDRNTPYGARAVRILLAALLSLKRSFTNNCDHGKAPWSEVWGKTQPSGHRMQIARRPDFSNGPENRRFG